MAKKTTAKKAAKKTVKKAAKKPAGKTVEKTVKKTAKKKTEAKKNVNKKKKLTSSSFLSKSEIKEFQELLKEKRRSLLGDMAGIEGNSLGRNLQDSSGDLSTMPTHPADIGSDNYEQEFTLGLLESERALLCEINEALDRIADNTFGICVGTGEPIGKARLRARPWCKYSIEYQRLVEKGLIRPGQSLYEDDDDSDEDHDDDGEDEREDDRDDERDDDREDEDED